MFCEGRREQRKEKNSSVLLQKIIVAIYMKAAAQFLTLSQFETKGQ